jgi:hypothetical protein
MAVVTNLATRQDPIASGLTGTQVIKFLPGCRVLIKTKDTTATPPTTKMAGSPSANLSGWTDLGVVDQYAKLTYSKETQEVRTGVDNYLRAVYISQKTGQVEFDLSQVDDVVTQNLTGISPSTITAGSLVQFGIGQEDVVEKALLLVMQNKLDGKEIQIYHPSAFLNFQITQNGDFLVIRGSADFAPFTWQSNSGNIFVKSIHA